MRNNVQPSSALPRRINVPGPDAAAAKVKWVLFTKYFLDFWWQGSEREKRQWLEQRLRIFRRYCVPSVLAQRERLTSWVVFAETFLHDALRAELAPLVDAGKLRLLSADTLTLFQDGVASVLEETLTTLADDETIVCTRVDNDDALALDYHSVVAALVQDAGEVVDGRILSFAYGAQLEERTRTARAYVFTNNHFLSSVHSKRSGIARNCLAFNHSHLFTERRDTLVLDTAQPMWLEVIHDDNLKNRAVDGMPLDFQATLRRFVPAPVPDAGVESTGACGVAAEAKAGERQASETQASETQASETQASETPASEAQVHDDDGSATPASAAVQARATLAETIRQAIEASGAMKPPVFADVYACVLSRVACRRVFEIGIHRGGSVRLWRSLLGPQATIACLDIKAECCANALGTADHVFQGSQTDVELLQRIGREVGPFDVIVDDGSHQSPHMLFTLDAMFPFVRPGGAYVVEDMFTSYWPGYGGGLGRAGSFMEQLKHELDALYAPFMSAKYKARFPRGVLPRVPRDTIAAEIESVEFFGDGIVVLHKRRLPKPR